MCVPCRFVFTRSTNKLCLQWAVANFGSSTSTPNTLLETFTECGLMTSQPCTDVNGKIIEGYDRYTCGNNMFVPSTSVGSVEEFLNVDSLGVRWFC
jgi:hypothetical protein